MDPITVPATLFVILVGTIIYAVIAYNALVSTRTDCDRAWANIDVLLKQRFDEVPNLVAVCKGYMQYESEILTRVLHARAQWLGAVNVPQKLEATQNCQTGLRRLFFVAANYPDLKADTLFHDLEDRITRLECQIADRRELYNDYVTTFNRRIGQFPDLWIARAVGFAPLPLLAAFEAHPAGTVA